MVHAPTGGTPTAADVELVRSAQSGEVGGLGLLLARHRGPMYAVALSILGPGSDAEDVVQDACLTALRRIGDVRDPEAVGSWLRALVRNGCRMRLRARTAVPVADVQVLARLPTEPDPAELLERSVSRDWLWAALEKLSWQGSNLGRSPWIGLT
jgi:RNA polymerase sigma factor (sigma-70 family)